MKSLALRTAVTIAVPVALYFVAEHALLPGVPEELLTPVAGSHAGRSHANFGVFALGVLPILTAYWVVEVIAFLVPRWSRLRGIAIRFENAPVGAGAQEEVYFARLSLRPGEPKASAAARFRRWLATIPLENDAHFGIEDVFDDDPDTNVAKLIGLRSFVLRGSSVLHTGDVTDAVPKVASQNEPPDVYVSVTLSPETAQRFEDLTREWTHRRMAIVLDDEIVSAPVIRSVIGGGVISVTMGAGSMEEQLANAKRLAARLRAH